MYTEKYKMDERCAAHFLNQKIPELIKDIAKYKDISITLAGVNAILNDEPVPSLPFSSIRSIWNMANGFSFVLSNSAAKNTWEFISDVNKYVAAGLTHITNPGEIRTCSLDTDGYDIPDGKAIRGGYRQLEYMPAGCTAAFTYCATLLRDKVFEVGNVETAYIVANHILLQAGAGVLGVEVKNQNKFRDILGRYRVSNEPSELFDFWYSKCLSGEKAVELSALNA